MDVPFSEKVELAGAVARALYEAFRDSKSSEPQLIANLVWALPKRINQVSFSGPTKLRAGGVFVHARPFVTCNSFPVRSPASVEIGDLLLVRTLVINNKVKERRALLLQAKKVHSFPAMPDNKNQWHLYEQWPRFTYAARSGGLTGKGRRIKEPDMYDAAKYLLIATGSAASYLNRTCLDAPACGTYHWPEICIHCTAQPTRAKISRYRCFFDELCAFMAGEAGKIFDKPSPRTLGWNRVVYDLIYETAKAKTVFMGRAAQHPATCQRGSGLMFMTSTTSSKFFMIAEGGGDFNEPPKVGFESGDNSDGGGISIVEFVIEQESE